MNTISLTEQLYVQFRASILVPEVNRWSWPGGKLQLSDDDAGCFLFRHARGFKRRRLSAAPKGRRWTKHSSA